METEGVTQVIERQLLQLAPTASVERLVPYETVVYRNPFKSMLEMVTCYNEIYQTRDIDRLKAFLSYSSDNEFNISHFHICIRAALVRIALFRIYVDCI